MQASSRRKLEAVQARYAALLDVAESITTHRHLQDLFQDISRHLRALVPFDGLSLALYDPSTETVCLHLLHTHQPLIAPPPMGLRIPVAETPFSLRHTQEPYYTPDVLADPRYPAVHQHLMANGLNSYCAVPLHAGRGFLGVMNFAAYRPDAYSPEEIDFIRQVGRQVAVAVENTLFAEEATALQKQLARDRDRLQLILDVNHAVNAHLEMRPLFEAIASALRRAFALDAIHLALYDPERQALRVTLLDSPEGQPPLREQGLLPLAGSPAGHAYTTRRAVVLRQDALQSVSEHGARYLMREGLASLCALPLPGRHEVLGTLQLASHDAHAFAPEVVELLTRVAGQIAIALDHALAYQRIERLNVRLAEEKLYLEDEIRSHLQFEEIVGQSAALRAILRQIETVAPTGSTVLICGETGTGKELIARAIHQTSTRRQATFVKLNCAAIPTGLLESELFGHEKGAFTGAIAQRIGRFELAHKGTIFLDEIGEIPLEVQPKLLRVLQEQEFERLGSARTIRADTRLIAATNRDLAEMMREHRFRADLYYRLNVFPIQLPPLRERREDIPLLVHYFTQQFARRMNRAIESIPTEAMAALVRYEWPGNVRELQNLVERSVILSPGSSLRVPLEALQASASGHSPLGTTTLDEAERQHIVRALEAAQWVVGGPQGAAVRLGLKRTTLQSRMEKLGIVRPL